MLNFHKKETGAPVSIKKHFSLFLFLNCAATLFLIGAVSCITIYTIHENTTRATIQGALDMICMTVENTYTGLNNTTKQFAYEDLVVSNNTIPGSLREYLDFLNSQTEYSDQEKLHLVLRNNYLYSSTHFITSVNPDVGLSLFYRADPENTILFSGSSISIQSLQIPAGCLLQESDSIRLHGLHGSATQPSAPVISAQRKVSGFDDVYVYVETSPVWFRTLLENSPIGTDPLFLMTNSLQEVIFSTHPEQIPPGTLLPGDFSRDKKISYQNYFLFGSAGDGWCVATAIPRKEYNSEITAWFGQFLLIVLLSLVLTVSLAVLMWRSLYRPISTFRQEFQLLAVNSPILDSRSTGIQEFDELLDEFHSARSSVSRLMQQMTEQETRQMKLEIEKIRMQINPHFIYNTLNSIQWMARLNQEPEIEQMATLFSRILKYNLESDDIFATLQEEFLAIQSYIDLQKMRYQFTLETSLDIAPGLCQVKIPRFILQPIVENAIFHGMNKAGVHITIQAGEAEKSSICLRIMDNGPGMTPEKLRQVIEENLPEEDRSGFGLGLKYVNSTIRFYYGPEYHLAIDSVEGAGTTVSLLLPRSPVRQDVRKKGNPL